MKIISAFEQNGFRIKRYGKPERSDVDEALLRWFEQQRSDTVPISGPLLVIIFVVLNFNFILVYFLAQNCMEIYNYRRLIFSISEFY